MTPIDSDVGHLRVQHSITFRRATGIGVTLLAVYFLGYVFLCSQGFFELARLPWSPHTDDWLYQIYRPLEWLRHLW